METMYGLTVLFMVIIATVILRYLKRRRSWSWNKCWCHLPGVGARDWCWNAPRSKTADSLLVCHVQHSAALLCMLCDHHKHYCSKENRLGLGTCWNNEGWMSLDVMVRHCFCKKDKKKEQVNSGMMFRAWALLEIVIYGFPDCSCVSIFFFFVLIKENKDKLVWAVVIYWKPFFIATLGHTLHKSTNQNVLCLQIYMCIYSFLCFVTGLKSPMTFQYNS